ncbi:hypothetical protein HDV05_002238 [Chytridiales sp. JEL 0842]|nr:hypothetical protein HDV05_002238 [Chytridiales sp. JEL 0842]
MEGRGGGSRRRASSADAIKRVSTPPPAVLERSARVAERMYAGVKKEKENGEGRQGDKGDDYQNGTASTEKHDEESKIEALKESLRQWNIGAAEYPVSYEDYYDSQQPHQSSDARGPRTPPLTPQDTETSEESYQSDHHPELQDHRGPVGYHKGLPQACLFVASLSSARTDDQLLESVTTHFRQWGPLSNVKVLKDWLSRPYAFVQFDSVEDAARALVEAHNTVIDNRHIRVEQARVNRTLFIAKFNRSQPDQVREVLQRYGPIEDLTLLQDYQTGKSKGCGFVKYCFREDAIKAFLGLRQSQKWVVEWAANLDRGSVELDTRSVFVGQLNQGIVTQSLLEEKFGVYGEIENIQLINRHPHGLDSRPAFAFIRFVHEDSAEKAVEQENAKQWLDRTIRVQFREVGEPKMTPAPRSVPPTVGYPMPTPPTAGRAPGGMPYATGGYSMQPFVPLTYAIPVGPGIPPSTATLPNVRPPASIDGGGVPASQSHPQMTAPAHNPAPQGPPMQYANPQGPVTYPQATNGMMPPMNQGVGSMPAMSVAPGGYSGQQQQFGQPSAGSQHQRSFTAPPMYYGPPANMYQTSAAGMGRGGAGKPNMTQAGQSMQPPHVQMFGGGPPTQGMEMQMMGGPQSGGGRRRVMSHPEYAYPPVPPAPYFAYGPNSAAEGTMTPYTYMPPYMAYYPPAPPPGASGAYAPPYIPTAPQTGAAGSQRPVPRHLETNGTVVGHEKEGEEQGNEVAATTSEIVEGKPVQSDWIFDSSPTGSGAPPADAMDTSDEVEQVPLAASCSTDQIVAQKGKARAEPLKRQRTADELDKELMVWERNMKMYKDDLKSLGNIKEEQRKRVSADKDTMMMFLGTVFPDHINRLAKPNSLEG